jgi:hypothetical protein
VSKVKNLLNVAIRLFIMLFSVVFLLLVELWFVGLRSSMLLYCSVMAMFQDKYVDDFIDVLQDISESIGISVTIVEKNKDDDKTSEVI